ncbi:MAG: GGDEF domain-containing protein [Acidobacteria bacterium]|nr:GGDEF domain-containing protein [Acidobacteriota bacterium]
MLSFIVSASLNLRDQDRRAKRFWMLILVSAVLWASAQLLWTHCEVFLRRDVPNPFFGDIILFLHLVPFMGAMAIRPDIDRAAQTARLGSLDFLLLFFWWLYLYFFLVTPWQYVVPDARVYGVNFDTVYFSEHLVLLTAVWSVWRRSSGQWRRIYSEFFAAAGLYACASIAAGVAIDFGVYYTGSFYDMPLLASMVLFTRASLVSRRLGEREPSKAESKTQSWIAAMAMAVAASLPLLAIWAVFFSSAPAKVGSFRLLLTLAGIVCIGGLRSWKQYALDEELDRANQELREASLTDVLTGARNRRFLATTIDNDVRLVLRAYSSAQCEQKNRNRDLIFYLVDIDHFKAINDAFGHDQGDDFLVQIVARLSSAIRYSDVLIRWGGEEFLVLSRLTNREEAEILASRVLHAVGTEPFRLANGKAIRRTCSIGWAVFPWSTASPEGLGYSEILRLADQALYQAKDSGRNRAVGLLALEGSRIPSRSAPNDQEVRSDPRICRVVTLGPGESEQVDAFVQSI